MRRVALLALVLAGCGGGSGARPAPAPDGPAERSARPAITEDERIDRLLRRRAAALAAGDSGAYAGTATGGQRARDRRAMRNRRGLPISGVAYDVAARDVDRDRAALRVQLAYRVRGVRSRFTVTRRMRLVKVRGSWRVRNESSRRDRLPWEVGRYRAVRSRHYVILAPAGIDVDVAELPRLLEAAYATIRDRLRGERLERRYLVVVAGDARSAQRLTAFIRGVETLSAVTDAKVRDDGPARRVEEVVALRLLVVWPVLLSLDPDARLRVLTHELTHAALTKVTSGRTPAWLSEGMALFVSEDRRVDEAAQLVAVAAGRGERRALTLTALSDPDAIARLSGPAQTAAYAYSSAAAYYVAARYGERRLMRLYDTFNDERLRGEGGPEVVDAALRRVLLRPLARFERDLRKWILTRAVEDSLAP